MKDNEQIVQGDVFLVKSKRPEKPTKLPHLTLALGEATGHHHSIMEDVEKASLYEDENGTLFLRTTAPVSLTHQEHAPVTIPSGFFQVGIVKEYDPFLQYERPVVD